MKNLNFILLFLFCSGIFSAQKNVKISGIIKDNEGFVVPYTTIKATESTNENNVAGTISDDQGAFVLELTAASYTIEFDAIGYEIYSNIYSFTTDEELKVTLTIESQLSDVVSVSTKPIYRFELDKKIYEVSQDISTRGGNLSDVLQNVPSVSVDVDGTVNLRGNSNVKFLINGKPSSMFGLSNIADVLKTIPASSIERIEVITNPSSRYEAEGTAGILNIILKKDAQKGFNGNLETHVGYQPNYGAQASLNWNKEKWGFYFNPGINYSSSIGKNRVKLYTKSATGADSLYTYQKSERERSPFSVNFNTGMHYNFSEKSILAASFGYRTNTFDNTNNLFYNDYDALGVLFNETQRNEVQDEKDYSLQANLNYDYNFNENGKKLSLGVSAQQSEEDEKAHITELSNSTSSESFDRTFNFEKQNQWIFNADYANPFKEGAKFELGYMGKLTKNNNDFNVQSLKDGNWVDNQGFTDNIRYDENVQAFYTQYGNTFNQFSFQAGIRSETSIINVTSLEGNTTTHKNYTNLFPTAYLNYNFNDNNQIQLNYSRRINRPRGRFLNPFSSFSDERNTFTGNPDLNPSYTHSIELGYNWKVGKLSLVPQLYYRNTQDDISIYVQQKQVQVGEDSLMVFVAKPYNVGIQNNYGIEVSFQYNPFNWWRMFGEFSFFGYEQKGYSEVFNFHAKDTSWSARYSSTFKLPFQIDMQLQAGYRGKQTNGQSLRKGVFDMNLSFAKDVFKKNATLSLSIQDVFNSRKMNILTKGDTFYRDLEMQWRQRQINLSLTYRFNQKKKQERNRENGRGEDDGGMGY